MQKHAKAVIYLSHFKCNPSSHAVSKNGIWYFSANICKRKDDFQNIKRSVTAPAETVVHNRSNQEASIRCEQWLLTAEEVGSMLTPCFLPEFACKFGEALSCANHYQVAQLAAPALHHKI